MKCGKLKGELLKLIYNKWIILTAGTLLVFIPCMIILLEQNSGTDIMNCQKKLIESFYLGQVWFIVIVSLYFGQELSNTTLRTSLLSVPKRIEFYCIKLSTSLCFTVITLALTTMVSIIILKMFVLNKMGYSDVFECLRMLIPIYFSIIALHILTSGMVVLFKSTVIPMAILISVILGLGQILLQFSSVFKILPVMATMNCFFVGNSPAYLPITTGVWLQLLWGISFVAIGFLLLNKRAVK